METLATLTMDIDVRSADPAESKLRALTQAAKGAEDQFIRASSAARAQATSHDLSASAASQAAKSLDGLVGGYVQARDALGRFTGADGSFRMSQEATAKVLLQNAKAVQALAKEQEQAAKAVTKAETDLQRRVDALTASYSPLTAAMEKTNKQLAEAKSLYDAGAISTDKYGQATQILTARLATQTRQHQEASAGAKLLGYEMLNLGRQTSDVFVQLATHQNPFLILVEQGPQIADVFQQAALRGVTLKSALAGIAAEVGPIVGIVAPLAAVAGVLALGTTRALENQAAVRAFTGELALNVDGLNYNAQALAATSKELSRYGLSAKDASAGLSTFVNAGVDADKLKAYSIAAKSLSEVSTQFKDVKSAQDAVAEAFTNGFSAVEKLDEKLNFLTVAQYEHIKAMFDAGKASEAQAEAFKDFSDQVDAAADKARGPWATAVRDLSGSWSDFLDNLAKTDAIHGAVGALQGLMAAVTGVMNATGGKDQKFDPVPSFLNSRIQSQRGWNMLNPAAAGFAYISQAGSALQYQDFLKSATDLSSLRTPEKGVVGQDSRADKAYLGVIDALNLELDRTKKIDDAQRVRLAAEKAVTDATNKGVTAEDKLSTIRIKAGQIEQARIDKEREAQSRRGDAAENRQLRADDFVQDAIAKASKDYLAAEMGLTADVVKLADYKKAQIDAEATAYKENLEREAKIKKVDPKLLEGIEATIDRTTALKRQAVDQQLAAQLLQGELAARKDFNSYLDQMASYAANAASSLEARQAIELATLKRRQDEEAYALTQSNRLKEQTGEITSMAAAEVEMRQRNLAFAQTEDTLRTQGVNLLQRDLEIRTSGYQNTINILQSEEALARSAGARREIEEKILTARYQMEKASLETALLTTQDVDQQRKIKDALVALGIVYDNQLAAGRRLDVVYGDVTSALDGAAQAIKGHDWLSATTHLFDAFQTMERALTSSSATLQSKIGAIAGVTTAIGGIVGGTAGSAISGIGSGAAAGATIGSIVPGVGTAIGGIVGGILGGLGGLFGGSSAKKQAREQAAAQAAAAEAQRQAQVADQTYSINLSLLQAQGKAQEAVAFQRQHELDALAKLDPSLVDLQKNLYAAQDAADAASKASDLAKQKRSLEIDLMDATGNSAGALAAKRADELAAMDESLRGLQQQIYAAQDLSKAQEAASAKAAQVAEKRTSIQDEIDKLTLSSSELTAKQREAERAAAVALDPSLGALIDKLYGLQDAAASASDATKGYLDYMQKVADEAAKAAEAQATALKTMTDSFGAAVTAVQDLTKSLNSFADALDIPDFSGLSSTQAYGASKSALNDAYYGGKYDLVQSLGQAFIEASKTLNGGNSAAYIQDRAYVQALARSSAVGNQGKLTGIASVLASLTGFADGGSMIIGGNAGVDQNVMSLNGVPVAKVGMGEMMTITPRGANDNGHADLIAEVRALRVEVSALRQAAGNIDRNTSKLENTLTNVTEGGRAMQTEAAS